MDENFKKYIDELKHMRGLGILPDEEIDDALSILEAHEEQSSSVDYSILIKYVNKSDNENPFYVKEGDSGFDLRATEGGRLESLQRILVPTGLYFELPKGYELQIRPRSGLAYKHGVTVLNTPGTVDTGYRGEVKVLLVNLGSDPYEWGVGERVAQGVISSRVGAEFGTLMEVDKLSETNRGSGGFGSTGTK